MNLTQAALDKRAISYFCVFLLIFAGLGSYSSLGRLEDPEFTVKTAAIMVQYPGASAAQVELEVVDLIESKLQEMTQLKNVYSMARPGQAIIKVDIQNQYWSDRIPQVWDVMRSKIRDIEDQLPPGAQKPIISDDFGFVFGFLIGISADGYNYSELDETVKSIRKELQVVDNVARVDFWGQQARRVYLNFSETQLSQLGFDPLQIVQALQQQNLVVNAGKVNFQNQRFRMRVSGEFDSPEDIGALSIGVSAASSLGSGEEIILLRDIAEIESGYQDPPLTRMRMNGLPAIGLAAAPVAGVNVIEVGHSIDARLAELKVDLPIGIELKRISWQSDQISQSISDFMISLTQAVLIVLVILAVTMGFRVGVIIGVSGLVLAILGTMIVMAVVGIDLHRVSLGAMVIAMGMMVDNAIVVADGFIVRLKQGMERNAAAVEAASLPSIPLLGSTVVACMAFYPIFASSFDTGEYAGSLFTVVAIALIISWLLSQTITPLMCVVFLPDPDATDSDADPYDKPLLRWFGRALDISMGNARVFMALMLVLLASAVYAYGYVRQLYFPDSARAQIMVDFWLEEGSRIEETSAAVARLEAAILEFPETALVSSFIGAGPPRFYLPVNPESNFASYAQVIINTHELEQVDVLIEKTNAWLDEHNDNALVRVRKYAVGAFDDWKFEARFAGPANAEPAVLRDLADQAMTVLRASEFAKEVRSDWRTPVREMRLRYNENRANFAGVDRRSIGDATLRAGDGLVVGLYREGDEQIPILARSINRTRDAAAMELDQLQVLIGNTTDTLPLAQVVDDIDLIWSDNIIWRWDRKRAITVQASPRAVTTPVLMEDVREQIEAIPLPPHYSLEWGGEFDSQQQSMQALTPGFAPAGVIMLFIIITLFNAFRPAIIIIAVIPFVFIGISYGLLITDTPFGFIALLGAMSLIGMMIKNAVVLLDEVNLNLDRGMAEFAAVRQAAISRFSPVMNAAATTVFGVVPLLSDTFWEGLAVTIMFGLAFGTILTMVVVPVLYTLFYRLKPDTGLMD